MINQLSEEIIAEYKESFKLFDKNGDGKISPGELGDLMTSMGTNPSEAKIQAKHMINEVDINRDGSVDFDEFCTMMERKKKQTNLKDEIRSAFRVFDKDGNGFISPDELRGAMMTLKIDLTDKELDALIETADTNGDGQLDYEEFAALMMA